MNVPPIRLYISSVPNACHTGQLTWSRLYRRRDLDLGVDLLDLEFVRRDHIWLWLLALMLAGYQLDWFPSETDSSPRSRYRIGWNIQSPNQVLPGSIWMSALILYYWLEIAMPQESTSIWPNADSRLTHRYFPSWPHEDTDGVYTWQPRPQLH